MPPGSRSQDDSDDTTTVDPLSTHRPRTPPPNREALQLCVETGKYSTELGDFPILKSQSDGALFEQLRESYNLIRQSHIPMRFRFRKPNQAIYVKVCMSLTLLQFITKQFVSSVLESLHLYL